MRSAILNRRLVPGQKLVVRVLAEELGLSPTPIKEALAALEREGLVAAVPHRGYFIPRITLHDIEELYALREVIEGLASRLAAGRADKDLVADLDRLLSRQRAAVRKGDVEEYGDLDLAFHRRLREASGNRRLSRVGDSFGGQIRLLISTSAKLPGRLPASLQEHVAVVEAIRRRNPAAAEDSMRRHVRQAGLALVAHLHLAPAGDVAAEAR